jgi:hypothetical protein
MDLREADDLLRALVDLPDGVMLAEHGGRAIALVSVPRMDPAECAAVIVEGKTFGKMAVLFTRAEILNSEPNELLLLFEERIKLEVMWLRGHR